MEKRLLHSIFLDKGFSWFILGISFTLMLIDNFLKMDVFVGGWHILLYVLLLVPLAYMEYKQKLLNPHTKWFFPLLFIMILDMFYYNNEMVQFFIPIVFYVVLALLYLTSMHEVDSFYQTLIPAFSLPLKGIAYIVDFFENFFTRGDDKKIYARIFTALLITIPFLVLFVGLLFSADTNFGNFLTKLFDFNVDFEMKYLFTVPLSLFLYLLLFIYGFSNHKNRTQTSETKSLDMVIVCIFLSMINFLFLTFIVVQIPFLLGDNYLPTNTNLAEFAREGFFQLMMVMGIVLLIFLFILRRFKGEKVSLLLMVGLLVQTIIMGVVSLKKMYLYQTMKGATVMRYYVEWFDYFLLLILAIGIGFMVRKIAFSKLLDVIAILGIVAFTVVISLNVDFMVAFHNIQKFHNRPDALDKNAITNLSIDALPAIQDTDIVIRTYDTLRDCKKISNYHYGYCSKIAKYGLSQYKKYDFNNTILVEREHNASK